MLDFRTKWSQKYGLYDWIFPLSITFSNLIENNFCENKKKDFYQFILNKTYSLLFRWLFKVLKSGFTRFKLITGRCRQRCFRIAAARWRSTFDPSKLHCTASQAGPSCHRQHLYLPCQHTAIAEQVCEEKNQWKSSAALHSLPCTAELSPSASSPPNVQIPQSPSRDAKKQKQWKICKA